MLMDYLQTIKTKLVNLYNHSVQTYEQFQSAVKLIYSFVAKHFIGDIGQFWLGLSRVINPEIGDSLGKSPNTFRVLSESFKTNIIIYMGSALFYEIVIKSSFRFMYGSKDYSLEIATDTLAALYFMRLSCHLLLDNTAYACAIAKTTADENPNNRVFKPCSCGIPFLPKKFIPPISVIKANLEAPIYYYINCMLVDFYTSKLPFKEYTSIPFWAYFYGVSFLEYNLSTMCMKHRYKFLSHNNAYVLGFGLSYMGVYQLLRLPLVYFEVNDQYSDQALSNFLFHYYIMLALLIDKPLRGNEKGINFFAESLVLTESIIKRLINIVGSLLSSDTEASFPTDKILNFPPIVLFKNIFLNKQYHTLESLAKTPAMQTLLDMRGDEAQNILDWLIYLRKLPVDTRVQSFLGIIFNYILPKKITSVVQLYLDKKLDGYIEGLNNFIATARIKVKIHDAGALKQIVAEVPSVKPEQAGAKPVLDAIPKPQDNQSLMQGWEMIDDNFFKKLPQAPNLKNAVNEYFGLQVNSNAIPNRNNLFAQQNQPKPPVKNTIKKRKQNINRQ